MTKKRRTFSKLRNEMVLLLKESTAMLILLVVWSPLATSLMKKDTGKQENTNQISLKRMVLQSLPLLQNQQPQDQDQHQHQGTQTMTWLPKLLLNWLHISKIQFLTPWVFKEAFNIDIQSWIMKLILHESHDIFEQLNSTFVRDDMSS